MLARVLSAALSAIAPRGATADVNGIEVFPVEVEVNSGWWDTIVVLIIMSISPILNVTFSRRITRHYQAFQKARGGTGIIPPCGWPPLY
jgi:hypothetical protein